LDKLGSKLFMLAVEMSADGIVIGDEAGYITYANEALTKLIGISKEEYFGKHILDFVDPADKQRAIEYSLGCKNTGQGWKSQFTAVAKDGSKFTVEVSATPIKDEKGVAFAFIDIVRDVSDRVRIEEELKDVQHNLELANEKLLVMGGLVRHDIANKLNALALHAYSAKKTGSIDDLVSAVQTACAQINRTIEFSRDYEMLGKEPLDYIDAGRVFDEVAGLFPASNLQVINECLGLWVMADSLLKELFYNLFENTLKYAQTATQIKLSHTPDGTNLKVTYEDNGRGIPAVLKPKLFTKGMGQGRGLGLYLIKKTTEVYGWHIEETGTEGKNARFTITLPQTKYKL